MTVKLTELDLPESIKDQFSLLEEEFQKIGLTLGIHRVKAQTLEPFDIGFIVQKHENDVGYDLYVDDEVSMILTHLLEQHNKVLLRMNWFDPDLEVKFL